MLLLKINVFFHRMNTFGLFGGLATIDGFWLTHSKLKVLILWDIKTSSFSFFFVIDPDR